MANSSAQAKKSWELDLLEIEGAKDGGVSPWFSSWGQATLSWLTTEPSDAGVFAEMARDPAVGNLFSYFDTEQPGVGHVSLACYIVLGFVILCAFVVLPLCCVAALSSRNMKSGTATALFIVGEFLLLMSAFLALACLYSLVRTWFSIVHSLVFTAPEAYSWAMQLLRNFTNLTVSDLKRALPKNMSSTDRDKWLKQVDKAGHDTLAGIGWLEGNLTAWDNRHGAYTSNRNFMAVWPLVPMIALGLAIGLATATGLLACVAFPNRKGYKALEEDEEEQASSPRGKKARKGRRMCRCGPKSVARLLLFAALALMIHLLAALPMISTQLPPCVLLDTYVCAPYRAGHFTILDEGVVRVWPPANRPDPFCRLVPSVLLDKCSTEGQTSIMALMTCPEPNNTKKSRPGNSWRPQSVPSEKEAASLPGPTQRAQGNATEGEKNKIVAGDCYYPAAVVGTSMDVACPLFTDDLVGHWMALTSGALCALVALIGAFLLAYVFLSGQGKPLNVTKFRKTVIRKRKKGRNCKDKKEEKGDEPPPPPPPPPPPLAPQMMLPPPSPPPPPVMMPPQTSIITISGMQPPMPMPIPYPVQVPTRRRSRTRRSVFLMPPAPAPPVMSPPIMTPSPVHTMWI